MKHSAAAVGAIGFTLAADEHAAVEIATRTEDYAHRVESVRAFSLAFKVVEVGIVALRVDSEQASPTLGAVV